MVTLGSDEELQAKQEEEQRRQQEEQEQLQQQYEDYFNQQQTSPWNTFSFPWEMWDWDTNTLGNPGSYSE